MSSIDSLSLSDLRSGLVNKDFTSKEVTQALLDKIDSAKDLNAFVEVSYDEALKAADQADKEIQSGKKQALLGVPIGVKDVILTKNVKSTCCSKFLSNFIPPYNATVTEKLLSAGSIIIGKTNMDEFAMGSSNENSAFGNVKNPWNEERVPGGSSGGSAAAVAKGLVPGALGTDTGGSIRQPAAFCGVTGLKPTYGRVSRYGVIAFASSLDQVGPITRNVRDCAVLTNVICGKDELDSTSVDKEVPDFESFLGKDIKGLKIGVPKEYFIDELDPEIEKSVKKAISEIENLGAEVVEVSLPHTNLAVPTYYIIAPAEASSNLARYDGVRYGVRAEDCASLKELYCQSRTNGFGPEVKRRILIGTYVLSSGYYDAYYLRAQKVRTLIAQDFKDVFKDQCDLIACPTAPEPAFKIGANINDPISMYLNDIFTIPTSLAGLPGMNIPCGLSEEGLPIGMQLIGKPWDEETLFKVAYAYESTTNWHKKTPV